MYSQDKPADDPTLVWFNGGPGCSSMLGMFQENGPVTVDTEGHGEIKENPHPWNARANVLYLEQPAGVGFSFGQSKLDYIHSDMSQSEDTVRAMAEFYVKFPEL